MKNNQQLITEIEAKINETKQLITNYKKETNNHEKTLKSLINQLTQIKKDMKNNNILSDKTKNPNKSNAGNSEINL